MRVDTRDPRNGSSTSWVKASGQAGEAGGWLFEPTFNRAIKLRLADPRITSNAGALLLREADHRLGLTADLAAQLTDERDAARIRYQPVELLRQHLYALALGYAHRDDQDALAHDVAMRLSVRNRPGPRHQRAACCGSGCCSACSIGGVMNRGIGRRSSVMNRAVGRRRCSAGCRRRGMRI